MTVGTSQIDHDIEAYVLYSFRTMSRVLLRPLIQLKYKDEGDKANGLTLPSNDAISSDRVFSASMISPVF